MDILLVCGAPKTSWPKLNQTYDRYVGIDRGGLYLLEEGLPLDYAVGDFDSLSQEERERVFSSANKVYQAPEKKDDTDTQLGLLLTVKEFPKAKITLIGATGGRIDHFLANLWLPLEPRFSQYTEQLFLEDTTNFIQFLLPGTHEIKAKESMRYLAYCCLTPVSQLSLSKSKYTLEKQDVLHPTSYASNEFLNESVSVSFKTGVIAVIQSKDK